MSDMDTLTVGFLGFGNMAQAMARGLIHKHALPPERLCACARDWDKLSRSCASLGIHPCRNVQETVERSDLVILAVKPYQAAQVLESAQNLLAGKILLSVAVGIPFQALEELLPPGVHHISTLPNTPIAVGEGILVCENFHSLTEEELALVKNLFSQVGAVQLVEPGQMGAAGTLSGCGPAFSSLFLEALADGAVLHGLPRQTAYRLAGQMLAGTGKLLLEEGMHPGAMKDAVCSPGGTTIVGVAVLEQKGFRSAVIEAIDAIEGRRL